MQNELFALQFSARELIARELIAHTNKHINIEALNAAIFGVTRPHTAVGALDLSDTTLAY